ncbi:reverse transcriptase domain-containing protein [Tanacetum coccineum]
MGDEDLNFIPNKELDKEDLIQIPRESKIGKNCDFSLCDDFQNFKTFSNPLFEKKDDFPFRNDESILKEEVHKETLKSYSNHLFEDDEEIISIKTHMTHLLEKETPFVFLDECKQAFNDLRKKLIESPILVVPNWDYDFEIMCDASDFALGAVLGQRKDKHFHPIHYASKTMTGAQLHYTTTEKEMLAVVYALEKFRPYLVLSKTIVYTDHSAIKYLMAKQDAKSRLENPHKNELEKQNITESFPLESLGKVEEVKEINVNDNVLNENENVVENNVLNNVNVLSDNTTPWFADLANYHAGKDIKVKKSKNEQKLTRNEETSTRERFEAIIEAGSSPSGREKVKKRREKDQRKKTILP